MKRLFSILLFVLFCVGVQAQQKQKLEVTHHLVDNDGVNIHFVEKGEGPLMVMLHGFPDFWYSWYPIMEVLSKDYRVVAMDLRGYNKSGAPEAIEQYSHEYLMSDLMSVINFYKDEKAILVGHDWGAAIAWRFTMHHPERVDKFISLSIPHLKGIDRALTASTLETGTNYTAQFFQDGYDKNITLGWFTNWGVAEGLKPYYKEAFDRSDPKNMLNYYKANISKPEELGEADVSETEYPEVNLPIMIIQGGQDPFITVKGLNDNWEYNQGSTTIHVIPQGKHFLQHENPELISRLIVQWLGLFK